MLRPVIYGIFLVVLACSTDSVSLPADPSATTEPTPTIEPAVIVPTDEIRVEPPDAVERVQEISAEEYELRCLGASRPLPDELSRFGAFYDDEGTIQAWIDYLSGTTIVDSNTGIKAFDLRSNSTGIWIDGELRPGLRGHEFDWSLVNANDEIWSDVDLTLTFSDDYVVHLPLRWRNRQIVNEVLAEGMIVTETQDCGEYPDVASAELDTSNLWQPVVGPQYPEPSSVIQTTAKPTSLLAVEENIWARTGPLFWSIFDISGEKLKEFKAVNGDSSDYLFDGEHVWLADRGEGHLRKFDVDANLIDVYRFQSPQNLAFDGQNIWATQSDSTELHKLSRTGEKLLSVSLPANPVKNGLLVADEKVYVGVGDEWRVNAYSLDGLLESSTYLHGPPGPMAFDGQNLWVSVPVNHQIRKYTVNGEHLMTLELPWGFFLSDLEFDGENLWVVDECCEREINGSIALRFDREGTETGRFRFAHQVDDFVYSDGAIWFSHDLQRAFTKLDAESQGEPWRKFSGPYVNHEHNVRTPDGIIGGTLTIPDYPGPHPLVVVAGNVNNGQRDSLVYGLEHGPEIANTFARHGIAVYRYDLPGEGTSTGQVFDYGWRDLADDLHVIVNDLKTHQDIDSSQIGIWALGAPVWQSVPFINERDDIAFAVFFNLTGTTPLTSDFAPQLLATRYSRQSEESIAEVIDQYNQAIHLARTGGDWTEFEERIRDAHANPHLADDFVESVVALPFISLRRMQSKFWPTVIDLDLGAEMEKMRDVPYFAGYGGLNMIIHPEFFEPSLLEAIEVSGNPDARTITFARMNDNLRAANSGRLDELDLLDPAIYPSFIAPGFMEFATNWILERVRISEHR